MDTQTACMKGTVPYKPVAWESVSSDYAYG